MKNDYETQKLNSTRPKMTVSDRAKQFAPFAALTGLNEVLSKKEKIIVPRPDLSEDSLTELNQKMNMIKPGQIATVVYYKNGECIKISGLVAKKDNDGRILQIVNNKISFDDILDIVTRSHQNDPV